jgi:hypothetical protein
VRCVSNGLLESEAHATFTSTTERKNIASQHNNFVIGAVPVVHDSIDATLRHRVTREKGFYLEKLPLQKITANPEPDLLNS